MTHGNSSPASTATATGDDASVVVSREELAAQPAPEPVRRARLEKFVVTEQRTISVTLAREEVRVVYNDVAEADCGADGTELQRELLPSPATTHDRISPSVVLYAQEPVVTMRWVPVQAAHLAVHTATETRPYTDTVRVEHIDTSIGTDLPCPPEGTR